MDLPTYTAESIVAAYEYDSRYRRHRLCSAYTHGSRQPRHGLSRPGYTTAATAATAWLCLGTRHGRYLCTVYSHGTHPFPSARPDLSVAFAIVDSLFAIRIRSILLRTPISQVGSPVHSSCCVPQYKSQLIRNRAFYRSVYPVGINDGNLCQLTRDMHDLFLAIVAPSPLHGVTEHRVCHNQAAQRAD